MRLMRLFQQAALLFVINSLVRTVISSTGSQPFSVYFRYSFLMRSIIRVAREGKEEERKGERKRKLSHEWEAEVVL